MTVSHWLVAPIVLPFITGACVLLLERPAPRLAAAVSVAATVALLAIAAALLWVAAQGGIEVCLVGNWKAPFGIALALDRLGALMLLVTALIATAVVGYARGDGRGDQQGAHFHALLQFQLMGLNGAFLTADLFNLFVFFEVLLIASYGLLLHGGGAPRLRASVHYVVFNLAASALFLIAVALLYGLTGTLNMADLARRVAIAPAHVGPLLQAAALLLLVVFAAKAALLPLYFWLPATYRAAMPPVAALFVVMTKVGVYCFARVSSVLFATEPLRDLTHPWLPLLALGTLLLATLGALAARRLPELVAYLVVASAGMLLLAVGLGSERAVAAGVYYLVHSSVAAAGMFLLADVLGRGDYGALQDASLPAAAAPATAFVVMAAALAGLPPLGGFIAKAMLLDASQPLALAPAVWTIVLVSGLGATVALARTGSRLIWKTGGVVVRSAATPRRTLADRGAVALLVGAVIAVAAVAGPLTDYALATAHQLARPQAYIDAVLGAEPVAPAWNPRAGAEGH
ncbi:MAG TPA: monovalent cation/H+ antiporter subunit D [Burkholderiaceae bacterium]|nr:monovalent cation/H+ antiporter subunit D [Burkholderiaceae bacterium]